MLLKRLALFLLVTAALAAAARADGTEKRVQFKPGASEAAFRATLDCSKARAECFDSYVLRCGKGQTMIITFQGDAEASVDFWRGDFHNDLHSTTTGKQFRMQFEPLPVAGDYYVHISPSSPSKPLHYEVRFEVID